MNDGVGGLAVARGQKKHYQLFANGGSLSSVPAWFSSLTILSLPVSS